MSDGAEDKDLGEELGAALARQARLRSERRPRLGPLADPAVDLEDEAPALPGPHADPELLGPLQDELTKSRAEAQLMRVRAEQLEDQLKESQSRIEQLQEAMGASDRAAEKLTFEDPLTGLPNLNLMMQYLDFITRQVVRYKRPAGLMTVDLDGFQTVNDALGFRAGDELLIRVSERLQAAVRDSDMLARRGEDEFLVLLSELNLEPGTPPEHVRQMVEIVARRILAALTRPFEVQGHKFYITASVGVSICPADAAHPDQMIEHSDAALHRAKERGRGRFEFYSAELQLRQRERLALELELHRAVELEQFLLLYQPILQVDGEVARLVGVEALLRWKHPEHGLQSPDFFLHAAEETGLILPIGRWVLRQVCEQMKEWLRRGFEFFAAINLSARQMRQSDLIDTVVEAIENSGVPPKLLFLDVAEGFNSLNAELADRVGQQLATAGVRVAIDDFGTGMSSLRRLQGGPTNILKIAPSIVAGCPGDPHCTRLFMAALGLSKVLGLVPLAKGVERPAQAQFVGETQCQLAQGYFFSEPVEAEQITTFARSDKTWRIS
ncbi:MAG: EAL domain-containing protein [Armatimonadetes bacterium]|nr:EAL domain-containing protein [Armatimonadota bacterium]